MRSLRTRRPGFTLVEMLVVTIIIGILVSLITVAAFYAMSDVKEKVLHYEEQQMTSAFQTAGWTNLPPTDLRMSAANDTNAAVYKWFRKNYPRYDLSTLKADIDLAGAGSFGAQSATTVYDPAFALVFWLAGFDPDVERPLTGHAARMAGTDRKQWKYDFDIGRLVSKRYLIKSSSTVFDDKNANGLPDAGEKYRAFLYFDSGSYAIAFAGFSPYRSLTAGDYYNLDTCQIVCSGKDNILGGGGPPPGAAVPYAGNDADNVANFGGGNNMKDFMEKKQGP